MEIRKSAKCFRLLNKLSRYRFSMRSDFILFSIRKISQFVDATLVYLIGF